MMKFMQQQGKSPSERKTAYKQYKQAKRSRKGKSVSKKGKYTKQQKIAYYTSNKAKWSKKLKVLQATGEVSGRISPAQYYGGKTKRAPKVVIQRGQSGDQAPTECAIAQPPQMIQGMGAGISHNHLGRRLLY